MDRMVQGAEHDVCQHGRITGDKSGTGVTALQKRSVADNADPAILPCPMNRCSKLKSKIHHVGIETDDASCYLRRLTLDRDDAERCRERRDCSG